MNMGLVNSHIAHWMQQPTGNSIRNVSLGTPRTMGRVFKCYFIACHVFKR